MFDLISSRNNFLNTLNSVRDSYAEMYQEILRIKEGKFTPEEIHNICHNLHGKVSRKDFFLGCLEEMRKLYSEPEESDIREMIRIVLGQDTPIISEIEYTCETCGTVNKCKKGFKKRYCNHCSEAHF